MEAKHWVEVDPSKIEVTGSTYLFVSEEKMLEQFRSMSNGALIFTKDTGRFFIYNKPQPVAVPQPSILRRWLRRAGWRS